MGSRPFHGQARSLVQGNFAAQSLDADRCHFATERLGLVARMHGAGWYDRAGTDMFQLDRPVWADRLFAETGS